MTAIAKFSMPYRFSSDSPPPPTTGQRRLAMRAAGSRTLCEESSLTGCPQRAKLLISAIAAVLMFGSVYQAFNGGSQRSVQWRRV